MDTPDVNTLAQLARRVGLITEDQVLAILQEMADDRNNPELFLRFCERKEFLTPYQSSKLLKGDTDGYFLGGYCLLYKIASGSFGRVYRAVDRNTGRIVAIKVLRRRWTENPHHIQLFEREGRVGLTLQHQNIVEIITVNRDPQTGQYYLVMEFVEGGNLRDILAIHKKKEAGEALRIIEDAAAGLAYAYSKGVTHRDMKLSNILISSHGQAKLVDFGLANLFQSINRMAMTSADKAGKDGDDKVDRTVDYAGLEKATGVKTGDIRSDIYFLGCVLYELLTGRSPLETTRSAQQRMRKERFEKVKPIGQDEVKAPSSTFRLVETMMSLNPQQRYQTPAQLLDAIKAARRDIEGGGAAVNGKPAPPQARSVFLVESDDRLQGPIRERFKKMGYRPFLASDPARALDRYRQIPYDALVVDAGTCGEDGLLIFDRVMTEAVRNGGSCAGILILNEEQAGWANRITTRPFVRVMIRPVTLRELSMKLAEMVPPPGGSDGSKEGD